MRRPRNLGPRHIWPDHRRMFWHAGVGTIACMAITGVLVLLKVLPAMALWVVPAAMLAVVSVVGIVLIYIYFARLAVDDARDARERNAKRKPPKDELRWLE